MKFEIKKWVLRVALAGVLSMGMVDVAKADSSETAAVSATPIATPAVAAPKWGVLLQEEGTQVFGQNEAPSSLNLGLQNIRLKSTFGIDAADTAVVQAGFANAGISAFEMLDAYDVHNLGDINPGLALKAGQFKYPFGWDKALSPDQLTRTQYSTIDAVVPAGLTNTPSNSWDVGVELDQIYNDLTLRLAAVQNPNSTSPTSNKDYVGRVQWKSANLNLGLSDYYSASTLVIGGDPRANNLNTVGANATVKVDVFNLDLEAVWGDANVNGYTGTLSAKPIPGFQPAVWYEFTMNNRTVVAPHNSVLSNDLGAGLNFWLGDQTRLAMDADFTGWAASGSCDILSYDKETVQLQEVF